MIYKERLIEQIWDVVQLSEKPCTLHQWVGGKE